MMRRRLHSDHGAAAVEFAVLLPLLLLFVFGIIDFGRAFVTRINLQDAIQEGAVYGVYNPTDTSGIRQRVAASADHPGVTAGSVSVTCPSGDTMTVSMSYDLNLITPFIPAIVGNPLTMSIQATGDVLGTTACVPS